MSTYLQFTYGEYTEGKQSLKRCVSKRLQNTDNDGADVIRCGRLFQVDMRLYWEFPWVPLDSHGNGNC